MAFFPRLSYLNLYGGELHRKGGVLMKARLSGWERELQYLRFRIAEWKEFGTVEHPDYYAFRSFLLQRVRNHLHFELKVRSLRDHARWSLWADLCELTPSLSLSSCAHTDAFIDPDGMRSGGPKRRSAPAAELHRQHLRFPRAHQPRRDHAADPPGRMAPIHPHQGRGDGRHAGPDGRHVREDPQRDWRDGAAP